MHTPTSRVARVLLADDHTLLRQGVKMMLDPQPDFTVVAEAADGAEALERISRGDIDLAILDGEAVPGGMGLCRQLKDEIFPCPPILVLTARRDDAWLATWSRADGVVPHPVDPLRLPEAVAALTLVPPSPAV